MPAICSELNNKNEIKSVFKQFKDVTKNPEVYLR